MWILINWLLVKPADQDLHCFQKRVKHFGMLCSKCDSVVLISIMMGRSLWHKLLVPGPWLVHISQLFHSLRLLLHK